ncbi:hypothetical protein N7478_009515 [Penicillium angulare]|uniref:uncharacterized protein n=1 Tax=Penicillium angulare TaxID=116970 RepID=UPI0025424BEF|nr:uncharacterized protein N7478_009515 [Penicillium angulare]KAJ5266707.1 hypothetical protein N7478_009515 [Penicillium angulare]
MNWTLPIIVFVLSNLWGLYSGVPYTAIQPSRSLFDRTIGSFYLATTVRAIGETAEYFGETGSHLPVGTEWTTCNIPINSNATPTMPPVGIDPNATVNPRALPLRCCPAPGNWIDRLISWLRQNTLPTRERSAPRNWIDRLTSWLRQNQKRDNPHGAGSGDTKLVIVVIAGAILFVALAETNRGQGIIREGIADLIQKQRNDMDDVQVVLEDVLRMSRAIRGATANIQRVAHGELQPIHEELRGLRELPGAFGQLFHTLSEGIHSEFAGISANVERLMHDECSKINNRLDTIQAELRRASAQEGMPVQQHARMSEVAEYTENVKFWKETWTEVKEEVKRTAEGFKSNMNDMRLNVTELQAIIDSLHRQFSRLPETMAHELAKNFNAALKKHEFKTRSEIAEPNGSKRSNSMPSNIPRDEKIIDNYWNEECILDSLDVIDPEVDALEPQNLANREFESDHAESEHQKAEILSFDHGGSQMEQGVEGQASNGN